MKQLTIKEINELRDWLALEADYNVSPIDADKLRLCSIGLYELKVIKEQNTNRLNDL